VSKKYIAVASSILLTVTTMLGIPTKAYAKHIKSEPCVDEWSLPKIWTPHLAKMYALSYMKSYYTSWGRGEHKALMKLWGKESGWSYTADNPKSTAYGIAQVLGTKHGTPAPQQVARGLEYVVHRYDRPSIAWEHWRKHGWY
jgi:hypothetical protein